jgi:type II secretory pathway pseudopilin PulG
MNNGAGLGGLREVGFTIIEIMIVLAVTSALFVAIAATLNGRENEAEFVHAVQDAQAKIQQVIDQVSAGYYSNNNNFKCTASGGRISINSASGSNTQGSNFGCVLLGKVIQFQVYNSDPNQPEQYQIYTIAGSQSATSGTVGTNSPFQNADPTVVGSTNGLVVSNYSISGGLEYSLSTLWIHVTKSSVTTKIGSIGFLMEPASLNSSTKGYNSGTQSIDLVPIVGSRLGQLESSAAKKIDTSLGDTNLTVDAPINPASGVQICMVSGGTNQSGLITIGGSGGTLLASLSIRSNRNCT